MCNIHITASLTQTHVCKHTEKEGDRTVTVTVTTHQPIHPYENTDIQAYIYTYTEKERDPLKLELIAIEKYKRVMKKIYR